MEKRPNYFNEHKIRSFIISDRRQSNTLWKIDEHGSQIQSGDKRQSKALFLAILDPRSSIAYRPTEYVANNPKQGLLGIIYIFHVPVIKKICFHSGYAAIENSWRTIDGRGSDIATTSVFDCQLVCDRETNGNQKTLFLTIFGLRSSTIFSKSFSIAAYLV